MYTQIFTPDVPSVYLPIPKKYIGKEIKITYSFVPVIESKAVTEKEDIGTLLTNAEKQYKEGKYTTIKTKKELNAFFKSL
jgi:hypothetical protein